MVSCSFSIGPMKSEDEERGDKNDGEWRSAKKVLATLSRSALAYGIMGGSGEGSEEQTLSSIIALIQRLETLRPCQRPWQRGNNQYNLGQKLL